MTRRPATLLRCIWSVEAQCYDGPIEHVFVIDDCPAACRLLDQQQPHGTRQMHYVLRTAQDADGPARLAYLRNLAVDVSTHDLIAFIDDDNEWEPDHLASLVAARRSADSFSHSERRLFYAGGHPFVAPEFPWKRDVITRRALYARYVELGAVTPGDNIWRDRVDLPDTCVDLGEWLLPRQFVLGVQFDLAYSLADWQNILVEDGKLARKINASGLPIISTKRPTLRYYLGGYSNNFSPVAPIYWDKP
ncbi:MAG: glycosyltransferase [Sciscionella sp.]